MATSKTKGLADQATAQLRGFIIKKKYRPGDLLPGEIELSEQLGVSRTIMREALSRFRMMGIIDSRRRRGMVLKSPDFLNGMELAMNGSWLELDTLKDMFQFRLMLEIGLADFIFLSDRKPLIKKLERIIAKEMDVDKETERMKLDADFHSALYNSTGNNSVIRIQKLLYPLFIKYASKQKTISANNEVSHEDLLFEIEHGTAESFRRAMRQHLDPHFRAEEKNQDN